MLAEDSWEDIDSVGTSRRGTTGCLLVCFSDGQPLLCGQTWGGVASKGPTSEPQVHAGRVSLASDRMWLSGRKHPGSEPSMEAPGPNLRRLCAIHSIP